MSNVPNVDERDFWSGPRGETWVTFQQAFDEAFSEVTEVTLDLAHANPGESILDIGCGTGAHSISAAERVAPTGVVLGVDISSTMIAGAQARTSGQAGLFFQEGDAQTMDLGESRYDIATSRFGVMFFEDPVAAFSNVAKALRPKGRIAFATWGPASDNPWWSLPSKLAQEVVGEVPPPPNPAIGPLALADTDRAAALLKEAGLAKVEVMPMGVALKMSGGAVAAADLWIATGPAARVLEMADADDHARKTVHERLVHALGFYETPNGVAVPSVINVMTAEVA